MRIFHKDVHIPPVVRFQLADFLKNIKRVEFSNHAKRQARNRNIKLNRITKEHFNIRNVVEVEVDDNYIITKVLLRSRYNRSFDICYPVTRQFGTLFVRTVWLNHQKDNHATLREYKYNTR